MERERRFFRGAARDSRDGDKRARRFFGGARGGGCTCLGANIIVECLAGKLSGRGEPWCTQNRPQLRSPDEIYTNVGRGGRGGGWKGFCSRTDDDILRSGAAVRLRALF